MGRTFGMNALLRRLPLARLAGGEHKLRCSLPAFWGQAAVRRADWYDPDVHPKLQSFAAHYGTVFVPTKPYTGDVRNLR